ncbi:MAG: NAD(P)/FAD-dependent oxidoreductase [Candidatus Xenobia bacterium]
MLDTIIIGGGPAGLTCAAELHGAHRDVLVLERAALVGEHLREIQGRILNWPGLVLSNGTELQQTLASWAAAAGLPVQLNHSVTEVDLKSLRVGSLQARSILIATGVRRVTLNLPAISDISYNPELAPEHFYDQPLAIVGGGDNAVWDALKFAPRAPAVTIIHRGPRLSARADWIAQLPGNVHVLLNTSLVDVVTRSGRLEAVRVEPMSVEPVRVESVHVESARIEPVRIEPVRTEPARDLAVTRLSVRIGFVPNSDIFHGQIDMTSGGQIRIAPDGATSCPGVFAAGDVATPGYLRLAAASGQGMLAAAGILDWLRETS